MVDGPDPWGPRPGRRHATRGGTACDVGAVEGGRLADLDRTQAARFGQAQHVLVCHAEHAGGVPCRYEVRCRCAAGITFSDARIVACFALRSE